MDICEGLTNEDEQTIYQGLVSFGEQYVPGRNYRTVNLGIRDKSGELIAGLLGSTVWEWLQVNALWVNPNYRGRGYGSALLERAEDQARTLGCKKSRLDTFDFEARGFYERLGYDVYAELTGFPEGHTHYHLWKKLA